VDVIVAANTLAAVAAKKTTSRIPIVFAGVADPVTSGLVVTIARPGGNVTGLSSIGPELVGKNLELLKQVVVGIKRVAALWHRDYPAGTQKAMLDEADAAARELGVTCQFVEAKGGPENFEIAFSDIAAARAEAVIVLGSVLFLSERKRLIELAAKTPLPVVYPTRDFVDEGGLMSYGALWADLYRRAAGHVDKILKGAQPSDLPVEQPTRFELVVNMKTAKALGLPIPQSLLARADEVIE
jgi:putative ABC transport system substrate-binding protein